MPGAKPHGIRGPRRDDRTSVTTTMAIEDQRVEARTLFEIASRLKSLDRTREGKSFFDEIIRRFHRSPDLEVRRFVALAHWDRASRFRDKMHLSKTEKGRRRAARRDAQRALAGFEAMLGWLGAPSEPELRGWVVRALILKGDELVRLHRYAEAVRAFSKVTKFVATDDRKNAIRASRMQGWTFKLMKKPAKALVAFDKVLALLGADPAPEIRREVGPMLCEKGWALSQLGRHADAIDAYDGAIAIEQTEQKPLALVGKADALVGEKRYREAIAVCNTVLRRDDSPYCRARAYHAKAAAFKGVGNLAAARRAKAAARLADAAARFKARRDEAEIRLRKDISVRRLLRGEALRPSDLVP